MTLHALTESGEIEMEGNPTTTRMVCHAFGDADGLTAASSPLPSAKAGQVLVEVTAIGVGFVDGLILRGLYQVRPPLPFTPGSVVAGRVITVGAGVTRYAVGDRVAALLAKFGGYATHVVIDAETAVPLPVGVSAASAAAALDTYGTAEFAVTERVGILPGEWVVVLGAGGGIGTAFVDVVRSAGARVVAVASTMDKRTAARDAGAETTLDYTDLKTRLRAATGGGADVIIDPVGGAAAQEGLRGLRAGGRFCVLGFASGEIPQLPANIVLLRNRTVIGVDWGEKVRADPVGAAALCTRVLARIAAGELHPAAPQTLPLSDASRALRLLTDRSVTGKIVLLP